MQFAIFMLPLIQQNDKDMTIQAQYHVTQTERKHINAFLDSGLTSAKVNTKYYKILNSDLNTIEIEIMTKIEKDYAGQKDSYSTQKVTVIK